MIALIKKLSIPVIFVLLQNPNLALSKILFQDNFDSFTTGWIPSVNSGHNISGGTLENPGRNEPEGWTGYINYGNILDITTSDGRNGSPCLRIGYSVGNAFAGQVGLVKFLGDDGYDEIYIRYFIRLSDDFHYGDGQNGSATVWKHGRVWQNITSSDIVNNKNLTSELNKGAMVWGWYENNYGQFQPYMQSLFMKNSHDGTNDCSDCCKYYYYPYDSALDGGHVTPHIGAINSNGTLAQQPQEWHSVEVHYKLADSFNGPNGVYESWIDGVKQKTPNHITNGCSVNSIPTGKVGTGINYITIMDNGTISANWTEQHYVYIDDIVISTTYIGPTDLDTASSPKIQHIEITN